MGLFDISGFRASGSYKSDIIISTSDAVPGKVITSHISIIYAVGGGIGLGNKSTIEKSYNIALDELAKKCKELGGNAIISCRISPFEGFVQAYGTAVTIET